MVLILKQRQQVRFGALKAVVRHHLISTQWSCHAQYQEKRPVMHAVSPGVDTIAISVPPSTGLNERAAHFDKCKWHAGHIMSLCTAEGHRPYAGLCLHEVSRSMRALCGRPGPQDPLLHLHGKVQGGQTASQAPDCNVAGCSGTPAGTNCWARPAERAAQANLHSTTRAAQSGVPNAAQVGPMAPMGPSPMPEMHPVAPRLCR